jgi:hypothetical protein
MPALVELSGCLFGAFDDGWGSSNRHDTRLGMGRVSANPSRPTETKEKFMNQLQHDVDGCDIQDYPYDEHYIDYDKLVCKIYDRIEELDEFSDT